MRIAIAQMNTVAGDFVATSERMRDLSVAAAVRGVDLMVFPLATLTGPVPPDFSNQKGYFLDLWDCLSSLAGRIDCPAVVSFATLVGVDPYAEAVLLVDGKIKPLRVMDPYLVGSGRDAAWQPEGGMGLSAGDLCTFEHEGKRFGLAFTYPDISAFVDDEVSVDALIYLPVYSYALDDPSSTLGAALDENRYRVDARSLGAWLVGASSVGGYGTQVLSGSSFVLAPTGELVASAPAFEEALIFAEICERDTTLGAALTGSDAQAGGQYEVDPWLGESLGAAAGGGASLLEAEIYNRALHLWEALSLGLHDFLRKQGLSDVVLAVGNDLASQLLAILSSDALGPTHVHVLPAWPKDEGSPALLAKLGVEVVDVAELLPLGKAAEVAENPDFAQLALASYARETGALALAPWDKTAVCVELEQGVRCGADLLPFGDVYRSDLVELAHLRNTVSPLIDSEVFRRIAVPAIDGLTQADATDEARLRRVDVVLSSYVEWERSLTDIAARQGGPHVCAAIVDALLGRSFARACCPPCLCVSTRTAFELRVPAGFAWRDRVRSDEEMSRADKLLGWLTESLESEAAGGPRDISALLEGVDTRDIEGSVQELLGIIRDMLQNGEGGNGGPPLGPFGPMTYGSPFSEN